MVDMRTAPSRAVQRRLFKLREFGDALIELLPPALAARQAEEVCFLLDRNGLFRKAKYSPNDRLGGIDTNCLRICEACYQFIL